jgi:apolipoprotein N-acyltransferase
MIPSFLAAATGGVLLSLTFPPARLDLIVWVAFIPLFWALDRSPRPPLAFLYGAVFGLSFFLIDVSWIYGTLTTHGKFDPAPAILLFLAMVLTLALFPAIFGLLAAYFSSKGLATALTAPSIWTALEYVRAVALTGFPWDLVGYSQTERLAVIQIADVTGVYGISFLVLLVNGTLWEVLRRATTGKMLPWKLFTITVLAVILVVAYGKIRLTEFPVTRTQTHDFGIGVLQANIAQEIKWTERAREYTFVTYEKLGHEAVQAGARLLVWPETSVPTLLGPKRSAWTRPARISERLGVPMVVGAPSGKVVNGQYHYYNSAFLLDGSSFRYRYDKMRLVPFGEYMPLSWLLPLGPGIAAREADYSPGESMTIMSVKGCPPFAVLICYEVIFPGLSRMAVRNGARLVMNLTNDGWFGDTAAPYQHLAMARLRSVENRVWLIRSANTGVSAAFDRAGRLVKTIPLNEKGFFVVQVPQSANAGSVYTSVGDLFAWTCLFMVLILVVSTTDLGRFNPARNAGLGS